MALARRKFYDLWANRRSEVARQALRFFQVLFRIEREIDELPTDERRRIRHRKSRRVLPTHPASRIDELLPHR